MTATKWTEKRTYQDTHPWLTFQLDLQRASYKAWMNLGAAQSKCEHVANTMLPPEVANELFILYLAKGIRATTAIEGNTLSEDQVRDRILAKNSNLPKSQEYQGKEVDNLITACREIGANIVQGADCHLTVDCIKRYNAMVLKDLPLDEHVRPGEIRQYSVGVGRYRGAPAEDCEHLLERLCHWINHELCPPDDSDKIAFGILRAVMAHLYLAWIHPFGDGNGRTARLLEFQLLLAAGVPAISAHLLSNHYNQTRTEYYRHLDLARRSVIEFLAYALQGLVDRLDLQIKRIRRHQHNVTWKELVYDRFHDQKTPAAHRQRKLALVLGTRKSSVAISAIRTLTAELAVEYAGKTSKTVARDVNELKAKKLLVRLPRRRVIANRFILQNFLPGRRDKDKWM